jgi:hypothetical protein
MGPMAWSSCPGRARWSHGPCGSLGEMLGGIRSVAESLLNGVTGMANTPGETGLECGFSVSVDADLVIASTAAQSERAGRIGQQPLALDIWAESRGIGVYTQRCV